MIGKRADYGEDSQSRQKTVPASLRSGGHTFLQGRAKKSYVD
jgi:hypothetical protein